MDIIFDIDGTLADCSHRLHWIASKPKNWKAFFAGMENDAPITPTITVAQSLYGSCNNLIFCTGRPNKYRGVTLLWLEKHFGDWINALPLYMRDDRDNRPDYVAKEDMLRQMLEEGLDPKVAFEDREQVVAMWRRNGLICYQVQEGNY